MSGIGIRKATLKDLDVLVAQRRGMFEAMGGFTREEHEVGDRAYRAWARRLMKKGEFVAWIAETPSGRPEAGGAVWLAEHQPRPGRGAGRRPYLLSMYTDPTYRRRGLATRIVKQAMEWARRNGYTEMTLHASKVGRRIYGGLGWKRTWEMRAELSGMAAGRGSAQRRTAQL